MPREDSYSQLGQPPLEASIAQALVDHGRTGCLTDCAACGALTISEIQATRCSCCGRLDTLEVRFEVQAGTVTHWADRELPIERIRVALEQRADVRLAVLYGSRARGDEQPLSDFDLMVEFGPPPTGGFCPSVDRRWRRQSTTALGIDLEELIGGYQVQVWELTRIKDNAGFLLPILEDGVVLVDRAGRWPELKSREAAVREQADKQYDESLRKANEAIERLTDLSLDLGDDAAQSDDPADESDEDPGNECQGAGDR